MTSVLARSRRAAALIAAVLISACATRPPESAASPWTSGRLVVRVDADRQQPARSIAAAFDLRGSDERGELRLVSPLGTLLATAVWSPGEARLVTSQGESRFGDLDELARAALGETLPLRALPDWLLGRPWMGAASRALADGFEQLGWQVALARLPEGQLDVRRDAPPVVTVRVLLDR